MIETVKRREIPMSTEFLQYGDIKDEFKFYMIAIYRLNLKNCEENDSYYFPVLSKK